MVASDNAGVRKCSNGAVTVLVVEDEPLILDMISQELTEQDFAVLEAETGEATVSLIKSGQTVDVLFTDIRLSGEFDGWPLAATARQAKPELPVIYVTGPVPVKNSNRLSTQRPSSRPDQRHSISPSCFSETTSTRRPRSAGRAISTTTLNQRAARARRSHRPPASQSSTRAACHLGSARVHRD